MKKVIGLVVVVGLGLFTAAMFWSASKAAKAAKAAPQIPAPRLIESATPAPFLIHSAQCDDILGTNKHRCTATVEFQPGPKQYNGFSVAFIVTNSDKSRQGALATADAYDSQNQRYFQPGERVTVHTPNFVVTDANKQPLTVVDITVQPDCAVDTKGQIWGNKFSPAVKQWLYRRAGYTQDEIDKLTGMH